MESVHEACLLRWLKESDTQECPHCHCAYRLETSYPSDLHAWFDIPSLPTLLSVAVLATLFFLFHLAFQWLLESTGWLKPGNPVGLGGLGPDVSAFLASMVPGGRTVVTLMNNSMHSPRALGAFNPAMLMLEVVAFSVALCGLYMLFQMLGDAPHDAPSTDDRESEGETAREGVTTPDGSTDDGLGGATDPESQPFRAWHIRTCEFTEQCWAETTSGSADGFGDDHLLLLPLDVLQTAFFAFEEMLRVGQSHLVQRSYRVLPV